MLISTFYALKIGHKTKNNLFLNFQTNQNNCRNNLNRTYHLLRNFLIMFWHPVSSSKSIFFIPQALCSKSPSENKAPLIIITSSSPASLGSDNPEGKTKKSALSFLFLVPLNLEFLKISYSCTKYKYNIGKAFTKFFL